MSDYPDVILYAIPFFVIAMGLELYVVTKRGLKDYNTKDAITSIAMGLGNVGLGIFTKILVFASFFYGWFCYIIK